VSFAQTEENRAMSNYKKSLGSASLCTSTAGFVLLLLMFLGYLPPYPEGYPAGPDYNRHAFLVLWLALFVILELVALGLGIAARKTGTGIAEIAISGLLLTLALGLIFFSLGGSVGTGPR
jgi:hypothetical protein